MENLRFIILLITIAVASLFVAAQPSKTVYYKRSPYFYLHSKAYAQVRVPGPGGSAPASGFSVITSVCGGSGDGNTFTTGSGGNTGASVNTTGSNLGILSTSDLASPSATLSDNKSNGAPTGLTSHTSGSNHSRLWYYNSSKTFGSGHTFTATTTGQGFQSFCGLFVSGANASPDDAVENTATVSGGTSLSAGSVTPNGTGRLIVVTGTFDGSIASTLAIDSGFTLQATVDLAGSQHFGNFIAWKSKGGSSSAENPGLIWTGSSTMVTSIAVFK